MDPGEVTVHSLDGEKLDDRYYRCNVCGCIFPESYLDRILQARKEVLDMGIDLSGHQLSSCPYCIAQEKLRIFLGFGLDSETGPRESALKPVCEKIASGLFEIHKKRRG